MTDRRYFYENDYFPACYDISDRRGLCNFARHVI
jgi:hypothetical protein